MSNTIIPKSHPIPSADFKVMASRLRALVILHLHLCMHLAGFPGSAREDLVCSCLPVNQVCPFNAQGRTVVPNDAGIRISNVQVSMKQSP